MENVEAELAQSQSDLQLAFKRIADLQATIEDEVMPDSDEDFSDDRLPSPSLMCSDYKISSIFICPLCYETCDSGIGNMI